MQAHFRYLRLKSFPTVPRAQQSIEIWPFNLHFEVSGVHRDSLSQNGSCLGGVSTHSLTLPRTSLDSWEYVMTPGLPLGPHPSNALPLLPGFLPLDSRASFLLIPATLQPFALVASPKLGLRHKMYSHEHIVSDSQETLVDNQRNKCVNNIRTIIASIKGTTSIGTKVASVKGVDNLRNIKATNFVNLFNQNTKFLCHNF